MKNDLNKLVDYIRAGESLGKVLSGNASDTDLRKVEQWVDEDDANNRLIRDVSDKKNIGAKTDLYTKLDVAAAWESFMIRLGMSRVRRQKRRRIEWVSANTAAAVLLLLVVFSGMLSKRSENLLSEESHEILANYNPGKAVAILHIDESATPDLAATKEAVEGNAVDEETFAELNAIVKSSNQYNKLVVPKGGEFYFKLADGSEVWLNSESSLKYFVTNDKSERIVHLTGEGSFKVAKDSSRPFKVFCNGQIVEVLGTEFTISAYPESPIVYTTLTTGQVCVSDEKNPQIKERLDLPGHQSIYNTADRSMSVRQVNPRMYTAWKEGLFIFDYSTLQEVMQRLSRWYNFEYEIPDTLLSSYHFSGEFGRFDSLEQVLEVIRSTGIPFKITLDDQGKVLIQKDK